MSSFLGGVISGSLIGVVVAVLVLIMVAKKALCRHSCSQNLLAGDEVGNRLSSYMLAFPSSTYQLFWGVRACELRKSATPLGFARVRSSWRPMFDVLGGLLNHNERYTPGSTKKRARVIPFKTRRRNGAGGGNRTHGLGIMRPSLFH
jgi:hypothetical protein